jgi:protein-disulfide isomerase
MRKILTFAALMLLAGLTVTSARAEDKMPVQAPDDTVLGQANAPITIIEYASLTCPHCAAFEKDTLPKVKTDWIETGKAKLIFRDYPLDKFALAAAQIARCAPADRYFSFIESFFETQPNWATAADPIAALKGIARLGGMTGEAVDKCLADDKVQQKLVAGELQARDDYGVSSTPTFFILGVNGGNKLIGQQPYDDMAKALKAASPKS